MKLTEKNFMEIIKNYPDGSLSVFLENRKYHIIYFFNGVDYVLYTSRNEIKRFSSFDAVVRLFMKYGLADIKMNLHF